MASVTGLCDLCERRNATVVALIYCLDCEERLCEQCEAVHNMIKATKHHETEKLDTVSNQTKLIAELRKLSKCAYHSNKKVKYLCVDHDKLCCSECAIIDHRKCSDMVSIDQNGKEWKAATGKQNDPSCSFQNVQETLEKLENQTNEQRLSFQKSENDVLNTIEEWERDTITAANEIRAKVVKDVKQMSSKVNSQTDARRKEIKSLRKRISESNNLKTLSDQSGNEVQQCLTQFQTKMSLHKIQLETEKLSRDMLTSKLNIQGKCPSHTLLETMKDNFTVTLDEAHVLMHKITPKLKSTIEHSGPGCGQHLIWCKDNTVILSEHVSNTITTWNVHSGKQSGSVQCTGNAKSMAVLSDGRIIVALPDEKTLCIVSVQVNLKVDVTVNVDKAYHGLAYNVNTDTILASSRSNGSIDILTTGGKVRGTIPLNQKTKRTVTRSYNIAYSRTLDICYIISNTQNKVVAVNLQGNVVFTYTHIDMKHPWTAVLDSSDNLYVTCWNSHNIYQIDKTGKHVRTIVPSSKDCVSPSGIAFSDDESMFALTTRVPGKQLQIYEFKYM